MTAIPSGTQFVGLSATYPTTERRSSLVNSGSEAYTIEDIATAAGGNSFFTNGFTVVGPIAANVTLPENAVVNYTGPLSMATGYILTVPTGTTLNIL
jgi:hypothetical protein